jgi:hypothetical protein
MIFFTTGDGEKVGIGSCDADGLEYVLDAAKCVSGALAGVVVLELLELFFFLPFPDEGGGGASCPFTFDLVVVVVVVVVLVLLSIVF